MRCRVRWFNRHAGGLIACIMRCKVDAKSCNRMSVWWAKLAGADVPIRLFADSLPQWVYYNAATAGRCLYVWGGVGVGEGKWCHVRMHNCILEWLTFGLRSVSTSLSPYPWKRRQVRVKAYIYSQLRLHASYTGVSWVVHRKRETSNVTKNNTRLTLPILSMIYCILVCTLHKYSKCSQSEEPSYWVPLGYSLEYFEYLCCCACWNGVRYIVLNIGAMRWVIYVYSDIVTVGPRCSSNVLHPCSRSSV